MKFKGECVCFASGSEAVVSAVLAAYGTTIWFIHD
jgi:hypothetical protein